MKFKKHPDGGIEPLPEEGEGDRFHIGVDEDGLPIEIVTMDGRAFPIEEPAPPPFTYKEIKKKLGLTDADIAAAFGLSEISFKTSSAKDRYKAAVEQLYGYFVKERPG
jgi:hypothetical protein